MCDEGVCEYIREKLSFMSPEILSMQFSKCQICAIQNPENELIDKTMRKVWILHIERLTEEKPNKG